MKRILISGLIILISSFFPESKGQYIQTYSDCSPLKFNGVAPAPWAIDGKIDDWETILGHYTGDPIWPFGPALGQNAFYDNYGETDPQLDLRVLANIRDDYNVYFYFRRLGKANKSSKMFYFLDTNLNAELDLGEPVICINLKNSQKVSSLSIGQYIPVRPPESDVLIACGGFPSLFGGHVSELLNSDTVDLFPNEKFEAAITEKGFGVEVAIPWRFISTNKSFAYRTVLQSGEGMYEPEQQYDFAGCQNRIEIIGAGNPDFRLISAIPTTIVPGFSYHIAVSLQNLTSLTQVITLADSVIIKNIIQNNNLPVDVTQFSIVVNYPYPSPSYNYLNGTYSQQPVIFTSLNFTRPGTPQLILHPNGTRSFSIDIRFPPDGSVKSAKFEINPKSFFYYFPENNGCQLLTGGGGKPINPIGIELGDETNTGASKNKSADAESAGGFENRIRVYPNPSSGNFNVVLPNSDSPFEMTLTDYTGKMIRKWSGVRQSTFGIENLKQGFYLLNIRSVNSKTNVTKKIIIQ